MQRALRFSFEVIRLAASLLALAIAYGRTSSLLIGGACGALVYGFLIWVDFQFARRWKTWKSPRLFGLLDFFPTLWW